MLDTILALLRSLLPGFQPHSRLALDNLALLHQLAMLHRQACEPKLRSPSSAKTVDLHESGDQILRKPGWAKMDPRGRLIRAANALAALAGRFPRGYPCLSLVFSLLLLLFLRIAVDHIRSDGKPRLCRARRHQLQIMLLDNRRGISRLIGHLGHVFVDGNERRNASMP